MLFNSVAFLIYLPVVFILYWFVFRRLRYQNAFVVAASYLFYGWWSWRFLILIAFTSLCSYASGILIGRSSNRQTHKLVLWGSVFINLGILGFFKYYNFFATNLQALLSPLGIALDNITLSLILPVGISFYTFQALSYSIDVYRGKMKPTKDIIAFFAFISFFPQLVAGPIERATNLLPQFLRPRNFDYGNAISGCRQILWGLFKKMVIADNCAIYVDMVFGDYESFGGFNLWIAAIFFSFQIYGDFSGYSDIAIGVAKLFGINLMHNFRTPYFSRDIAEFWRRWHISLNTWFRDYIYIPLGGSRVKKHKVVRNTFVIFLVSGLWHGAEWTFVAWGAYHSLLFLPLLLTGKNRHHLEIDQEHGLPSMKESTYMALTFLLVTVGWIIFRSETLSDTWHYIARMFTDFHATGTMPGRKIFIWIALLLSVEWIERHRPHPFDIAGNGLLKWRCARWCLYILFILICFFFAGRHGDFIYFQF